MLFFSKTQQLVSFYFLIHLTQTTQFKGLVISSFTFPFLLWCSAKLPPMQWWCRCLLKRRSRLKKTRLRLNRSNQLRSSLQIQLLLRKQLLQLCQLHQLQLLQLLQLLQPLQLLQLPQLLQLLLLIRQLPQQNQQNLLLQNPRPRPARLPLQPQMERSVIGPLTKSLNMRGKGNDEVKGFEATRLLLLQQEPRAAASTSRGLVPNAGFTSVC